MSNTNIQSLLKRTDYDNEYNLRGFYNEYLKAQEMIKQTKLLYLSFVQSKLKPLTSFITSNKIDRLKLYRYSVISSVNETKEKYTYTDDMPLYLARFVWPLIHKRLHDETVVDKNCPWIYPCNYTIDDEDLHSYTCFNKVQFSSKDFYSHTLIEKQSNVNYNDYGVVCYPSTVGCHDSYSYGYNDLSNKYRANKLKLSIFKTEKEAKKSYSEWAHKLYRRFDEIKKEIYNEIGPTIDLTNKFQIMVDVHEVTTMTNDMKLRPNSILPKSIWLNTFVRTFIPYTGYDVTNTNGHPAKILNVDFNISKFKKDDINWDKFIEVLSWRNTERIWNYIDKTAVDKFVDNAIGDYFIKYIECYDNNKSSDDCNNLYIMFKNEPMFVCKKNEITGFTIEVKNNKLYCYKEDISVTKKPGPGWLPRTQTTKHISMEFDIDTNELLAYHKWDSSCDVSYN